MIEATFTDLLGAGSGAAIEHCMRRAEEGEAVRVGIQRREEAAISKVLVEIAAYEARLGQYGTTWQLQSGDA